MVRRVVIRVIDPSDGKKFITNQTIVSPGIFSVNVPREKTRHHKQAAVIADR